MISKEEKVETLVLKLRNSFSQLLKGEQFVFLRTTKSDLFPVDKEMADVDAVLNLAGSSGLFISTLTPAIVSTPTQQVKSQLTPIVYQNPAVLQYKYWFSLAKVACQSL